MYNVLTGKQRSLVFPIMCNSHVKLDYSDNVPDIEETPADTTDDTGFGIYNHTGSFTFETIITPYDITHNSDKLTSKKIMPLGSSSRQSTDYLLRSSTIAHEMRIFHSSNFQISLVNSVSNVNNLEPSRYKIKVGIKLGSAPMEYFITDEEVIVASFGKQFFYDSSKYSVSFSGHTKDGRMAYLPKGTLTSAFTSGGTSLEFSPANPSTSFSVGDRIYHLSGKNFLLIGTIASFGATTINIASAYNTDIDNSSIIYIEEDSEPTYINNSYHIACTFNNKQKTVSIYLDGIKQKTGTHTQTTTFEFPKEDYYIGANGTNKVGYNSATDNNQFMGEIHEMCITNVVRRKFPYVLSLMPNYENALFYLRFEEVDL